MSLYYAELYNSLGFFAFTRLLPEIRYFKLRFTQYNTPPGIPFQGRLGPQLNFCCTSCNLFPLLSIIGGGNRMSVSPGKNLGLYEILSTLGAGGIGEVYKARDTRLDRTVAIKVLPDARGNNG